MPDLHFIQSEKGLPPSHDALVLARLVPLAPGLRVIDLGAGQGVIALLLAARERIDVLGLEREVPLLEIAAQNKDRNQKLLQGNIQWLAADLRSLPFADGHGGFDVVVMNPPYHPSISSRLPADPLRASARHEVHGSLADWIAAAAGCLAPAGDLYCVHRPERENALIACLRETGLPPRRVFRVSANADQPVRWVVVHARAGD